MNKKIYFNDFFQLRIFDEYQNGFDWKLMEEKQKTSDNLMTMF